MKKYKVGIIGLGLRGGRLARELLTEFPNIEITGLCDLYEDRLKFSVDAIEEKTGIPIKVVTTDYRELIDSEHIDTVFVFSGWENHFDAAVRAMKKRKPIGLEVGGAYSILQCYELVRVYEETQTPFMLLENCCYGEIEMTVTNMVRKGLFGTVVHCDGGYCHEMRNTLSGINRDRHYRVDEYINRNCESYPTHELGPIAKLLNIGNGNRFVSLVSMSSKAAGMKEFLADKDNPYKNVDYAQGDIFTTLIKCAGGETIRITLDTTLPRYYSRDFTIRGTKAMYEERTNSVFFDNNEEHKKKAFDTVTIYAYGSILPVTKSDLAVNIFIRQIYTTCVGAFSINYDHLSVVSVIVISGYKRFYGREFKTFYAIIFKLFGKNPLLSLYRSSGS